MPLYNISDYFIYRKKTSEGSHLHGPILKV